MPRLRGGQPTVSLMPRRLKKDLKALLGDDEEIIGKARWDYIEGKIFRKSIPATSRDKLEIFSLAFVLASLAHSESRVKPVSVVQGSIDRWIKASRQLQRLLTGSTSEPRFKRKRVTKGLEKLADSASNMKRLHLFALMHDLTLTVASGLREEIKKTKFAPATKGFPTRRSANPGPADWLISCRCTSARIHQPATTISGPRRMCILRAKERPHRLS